MFDSRDMSVIRFGTTGKVVEMLVDAPLWRVSKHLTESLESCNLLVIEWQKLREVDLGLVNDVVSELQHWQG